MNTNILYKFEDLVDICFGVYATPGTKGPIGILQVGNFDQDGCLKLPLDSYISNSSSDKDFLKKDDVLLAAKGVRNFAYHFNQELEFPVVASSIFFVLRIKNPEVLPSYLVAYFNSNIGQTSLKTLVSKSTTVMSIKKNDIVFLQIPVPSIEVQKRIIEFHSLWQKERHITHQLLELKENQYQGIFSQLITNQLSTINK